MRSASTPPQNVQSAIGWEAFISRVGRTWARLYYTWESAYGHVGVNMHAGGCAYFMHVWESVYDTIARARQVMFYKGNVLCIKCRAARAASRERRHRRVVAERNCNRNRTSRKQRRPRPRWTRRSAKPRKSEDRSDAFVGWPRTGRDGTWEIDSVCVCVCAHAAFLSTR